MTTEPTDAEIIAVAATEGVRVRTGAVAIKFAHAVLAKWGTPAPVGVGEVAEHYRNAIASACEGWTMPDGLRKHLETALWSPPTSQPTQAQATEPVAWLSPWRKDQVTTDYDAYGKQGIPLYAAPQPVAREPLTDGQIQDLLLCGDPTDEEMRLIRIGWDAANGIKGGQHVE